MTEHLKVKHKLQSIPTKAQLVELIEVCSLSPAESSIIQLRYLEHKDFGYISDFLGFSESWVRKLHKQALYKISKLL